MVNSPLVVRLFGPMRVLVRGEPLPHVRTRSVEFLLALLTLRRGRLVDRAWLAGTLWPDSEEGRARQNLRNCLVELRAALGPESSRILSPTRSTLSIDLDGADVDFVRFEAGIAAGLTSSDEVELQRAVDAYTGPLLEGCYADWATSEREALAARCLEALELLADKKEAQGELGEAVRWLRRAESLDPVRESTIRRLMTALDATGDHVSAMQAYRDFRDRLHERWKTSPQEETTSLYARIRSHGQLKASGGPATPGAASPIAASNPSPSDPRGPVGAFGIESPLTRGAPHALTSLIGREEEVSAVCERVLRSRLVTLVGAGGVGKTRIAMAVASRLTGPVAGRGGVEGLTWVELAPATDSEQMAAAIARAFGLHSILEDGRPDDQGDTTVRLAARLAAHLGDRHWLLALDNCEHLLDPVARTAQILLGASPNLRLLATSRQRLGPSGETVWSVPSLPAPQPEDLPETDGDAAARAMDFPAVKLFVERAESARPGFRLESLEDIEAVCTICRRLDGIPLAIELAAARFGLLSLPQIADRLNDRFRLLGRGSRSALPRHQTLRALIDWSYDHLTDDERQLLGQLAVFSGGWTLEAVDAIQDTGSALDLLASLVDKSLVQEDRSGSTPRYRLLETIREYAIKKLRSAGVEEIAGRRHVAFVLQMAEKEATELAGARPDAAMARLSSEIDNIRAAMARAESDPPLAEDALRLGAALWPFWLLRNHFVEGNTFLTSALNRTAPATSATRASALLGVAILAFHLRQFEQNLEFSPQSLAMFRELQDPSGTAAASLHLGHVHFDDSRAPALLCECIESCRAIGWNTGTAIALVNLGVLAWRNGDAASAKPLLEEGIELMGASDDDRTPAYFHLYLAPLAQHMAGYAGSRAILERALVAVRRSTWGWSAASLVMALGDLAGRQGDYPAALEYLRQAVAFHRAAGNPFALAYALLDSGNLHYRLRDYHSAESAYRDSLQLFRRLGNAVGLDTACNNLGSTLFHLGDPDGALSLHMEALRLYHQAGVIDGMVWALERTAVVEAKAGEPRTAARLLGAAARARSEHDRPRDAWDEADWVRAEEAVLQALGAEEFALEYGAGRARPLQEVVERILLQQRG